MDREKIINEIREKLDGINGCFEPTEPTYVLYSTNKPCRVLSVYLDDDRCVWFTLESEETGRFGAAFGWIGTESLLEINKILPTKWAVVRFLTPYGGCDMDWLISRESIPANSEDPQGELEDYLYKNYPALRWSNTDVCEFVAHPEEEDSGAFFIATVED